MYFAILTTVLLLIIKYMKLILELIRSFFNKTEQTKFNPADFQYVPIDHVSCVQQVERIKKRLAEFGYDKSPLFCNINKIDSYLPRMLDRADKCSCGLIQANGYFSIVKLMFRFFELMNKELEQKKSEKNFREKIDTFTIYSQLLLKIIYQANDMLEDTNLENEQTMKNLENELLKYPPFQRTLPMYRQIEVIKQTSTFIGQEKPINLSNTRTNLDNHNGQINDSFNNTPDGQKFNSLPLFTPHLSNIFNSCYETIAQPTTSYKEIIYRKYFFFWIDPMIASFFQNYALFLPFLRAHFYQYPKLIFSAKFRSETLNKILSYPSINFPFLIWDLSTYKISRFFFNLKSRNPKVKSYDILVPTQNSIEINKTYEDRLRINDVKIIKFKRDREIRCKFLYPKNMNLEKTENLILHFFGGGFYTSCYDSFHLIYLRYWVDYNKTPALVLDYRKKREFPVGLKDCFDVYLWLRTASEDEIRSKLGFYPKNIVITGESSGANFAISVALILNDLRTQYQNKFDVRIPMPDGLLIIYAPLLIHTSISPSRAASATDIMIPLGVQLQMLYGLTGHIPNLKPNSALKDLILFLFPSLDTKAWFDCAKDEFFDKVELLAKEETSPYLSPLFYDKYDQLTDVRMHLITAEFDSFLDDAITLAKLYRGPLKVDVFPDQPHGFLSLEFERNDAKGAKLFCAEKLREMFATIKNSGDS